MNDRKEFDRGVAIAINWIKKRGGELFRQCVIDKRLEILLKNKKKEQVCVPYVLSFTTEKDSMPQWMAYTDSHSGGMAIGLDFKELERAIGDFDKEPLHGNHVSEVLFAPCIYCSEDDAVDRYEAILERIFSGCEYAWNSKLQDEFVNWCAAKVFQFAALVKSEAFRFEKEWRLVIRPRDKDYALGVKFIGGKPRLLPPELKLKGAIKTLEVSPHGNRDRIEIAAKLLSMKCGNRIKVKKSMLSYCGN